MIDCGNCEQPFNPEASRWLCPRCGWKNSCCEGEPVYHPRPVSPRRDAKLDTRPRAPDSR